MPLSPSEVYISQLNDDRRRRNRLLDGINKEWSPDENKGLKSFITIVVSVILSVFITIGWLYKHYK